jgi:hypothetical protein
MPPSGGIKILVPPPNTIGWQIHIREKSRIHARDQAGTTSNTEAQLDASICCKTLSISVSGGKQ